MFKVGDFITPVREDIPNGFHHWRGMQILGFDSFQMEATVKTKDGDIITHFNLDPEFGEAFKVIE